MLPGCNNRLKTPLLRQLGHCSFHTEAWAFDLIIRVKWLPTAYTDYSATLYGIADFTGVLFFVTQGAFTLSDWWLSQWYVIKRTFS